MRHVVAILFSAALGAAFARGADAQQNDQSQFPNAEEAGIKKTLAQQVGAGRGDAYTADSSTYIIQRDPFRSIRRGRQIFQRKFTLGQGFGPRVGDGSSDPTAPFTPPPTGVPSAPPARGATSSRGRTAATPRISSAWAWWR